MTHSGWHLLTQGLRGQRRRIATILAWTLVEALPTLVMGIVLRHALDRGFLVERPIIGLSWLGALLLLMIIGAVATRIVYPQLAGLIEPLRDSLIHRVVDAALHPAGTRSTGTDPAAVARLTEQVEATRRLVAAMLRTARQFGVGIMATVLGVTVLAPILALLVAPPLVISVGLFIFLLPRLARRQRAVIIAAEQTSQRTTDMLAGLRDVLACQAADRAATDVGAAINHHVTASRRLARTQAVRLLVVAGGAQVPLITLIAAGPALVAGDRITAGTLVAATAYLTVTLQPALAALVQVVGTYGLQLMVVLDRLAETVPATPTATPGTAANTARPTPSSNGPARGYRLVVTNLTFAYGPHADPVLADLSLTLEEDSHLAVVGPSGAGKSTLADLLAGLSPPSAGRISIGGIELADWEPESLRKVVTLIPQEAYVFAGTLRDNVTYLASTATPRRLSIAADAVGLDPLARRLGGWSGWIYPDELTPGERQQIALARAYASPAPIVILDEATCHLDPHREVHIEQAFKDGGGTMVIIAHRISSALRSDHILVLDGDDTTIGSHSQLLEHSALYRALVGYWEGSTATMPLLQGRHRR